MLGIRLLNRCSRLPSCSSQLLCRPLIQAPSRSAADGRSAAEAEFGRRIYVSNTPSPRRLKALALVTWMYSGVGAMGVGLGVNNFSVAYDTSLSTGAFVGAGLITAAGLGAMFLPALLNRVMSRYVQLMFYNEKTKTFTAVTPTVLMRQKAISFKGTDLRDPGTKGLMTTALAFGTEPLLFSTDPMQYTNREAYEELVGTYRPLDERFPELSHQEVKEKWEKEQRKKE